MTSKETLAKYGLATDVKSIKERIDNDVYFDFLYNGSHYKDIVIVATLLQRADLEVLCGLAEKAEKIADYVQAFAEAVKHNCVIKNYAYGLYKDIKAVLDGEK